ncbi:MAG: hypothetical protein WCL04_07550 [Verrucomicrobiota bacterium]
MLRALLLHLFRRPAGRMDPRRRTAQVRQAQFMSFVEANGCLPPRRLGAYDARLRRARLFRRLAFASLAALGTWFVVESAHALARF